MCEKSTRILFFFPLLQAKGTSTDLLFVGLNYSRSYVEVHRLHKTQYDDDVFTSFGQQQQRRFPLRTICLPIKLRVLFAIQTVFWL